MSEAKVVVKAAENNKDAIFKVLEKVLPEKFGNDASLSALEISSGSGQHVVYFAERFPKVVWQPSDIDERYLESIKAYITESKLENVKLPVTVDVTKDISEWPEPLGANPVDVLLNINMVHITPWACTEGLFAAAAKILKPSGIMVTYGPYAIHGEISPESNVSFNESLKSQNAAWGLRDIDDLEKEAKKNGLNFDAMFDMPSNNKTLIWVKSE